MKKKRSATLYYSMQAISVLPLLIYGLIIIAFNSYAFSKSMNQEITASLEDSAELCIALLDTAHPGDYTLKEFDVAGQTAYSLYKGEADITSDYTLLDNIKESTGMDATLFYQDTRILTTIRNWDNQRIVGSTAPTNVIQDVLKTNQEKFYDNVIINGQPYFALYHPLTNEDGSIVGMLFIGKPTATVQKMRNSSIYPIIIVSVVALAIASIVSYTYSKRFLNALLKLKKFFRKVSTGDLNAKLDASILNRSDELSEIGEAVVTMQNSLRDLIELDTLTKLYNRRSGNKKLTQTHTKSKDSNTPFCIVLADIDYFKSINDTYGHHNGDIVLQNVAALLMKHTKDRGYAIRWGGEEFLLVFEKSTLLETLAYLKQLQNELHEYAHIFEDNQMHVTMTFGVASDINMDIHTLITTADAKLYQGKSSGRDCIIS